MKRYEEVSATPGPVRPLEARNESRLSGETQYSGPQVYQEVFRALRQSAVAIGHYLTPGISTSSTSVRIRPETVNAVQGFSILPGSNT
jgi:hypothetical protein